MALSSTVQDLLQAWRGAGTGDSRVTWIWKVSPQNLVTGATEDFYFRTVDVRGGSSAPWFRPGLLLPSVKVSLSASDEPGRAFNPGAAITTVEYDGIGFENDGMHDDLCNRAKYAWSNAESVLYVGDVSWTWGGSPDFEVALAMRISGEPQWQTPARGAANTEVRFSARSALYDVDADVRDYAGLYFKGSGGREGSAELRGKPKPIALGTFKGHKPAPLDSFGESWLVHGGSESIGSITAVYEGGVLLTLTTDYTVDLTQGGVITLVSAPTGPITCDGTGATGPADSTASGLWDWSMQNYAGLTAGQTDLGSHATDYPETCGIVVPFDQAMTLAEFQRRLLAPRSASVQLFDGSGVKLISDKNPRTTAVDQAFGSGDIESVASGQPRRPASSVMVAYDRIADPLSLSDVLGAVDPAERIRQSSEFRWAESLRITSVYNNAASVRLESAFTSESDAQTEADAALEDYRDLRVPFDVALQLKVLGWVDIGDIVSIVKNDGAGAARYNLDEPGGEALMETGDTLLLESGDKLLLEGDSTTHGIVVGINADLEALSFGMEILT